MRCAWLIAFFLPLSAAAQEYADTNPLAQQWDAWLRGKRLTQIHSYSSGSSGGTQSRADLFLCRDGTFLYTRSGSTSITVPGASGSSARSSKDRGSWRIVSNGRIVALEVAPESAGGQKSYHDLSRTPDGKTFMGRERTFVTDENKVCS